MTVGVKVTKPVHTEKVHVKIVEQWDIAKNNAHNDLEKYQLDTTLNTLQQMM
jgi:hypothetical protein